MLTLKRTNSNSAAATNNSQLCVIWEENCKWIEKPNITNPWKKNWIQFSKKLLRSVQYWLIGKYCNKTCLAKKIIWQQRKSRRKERTYSAAEMRIDGGALSACTVAVLIPPSTYICYLESREKHLSLIRFLVQKTFKLMFDPMRFFYCTVVRRLGGKLKYSPIRRQLTKLLWLFWHPSEENSFGRKI